MVTQQEIDKCIQAISQTGYVLENSVATVLAEQQWNVMSNRYYLDDVTYAPREIDLLAYKVKAIDNIRVYTALIISCKKSDKNAWVFLTKNLNKRDKNIELHPINLWSNSRIMLGQNIKQYFLTEISTGVDSDPVLNELFNIDRNIFAYQEVNLENGTPQNDKRIYDSITTCIKAAEYEKNALKNTRRQATVYQFTILNIVESRMIEYFCDAQPAIVKETDHIMYLNRFIINKADNFHIIHFITNGYLKQFLEAMDQYHSWSIEKCKSLHTKYKSEIITNHEMRNLFADEIAKDILFSVRYKVQYELKSEYSPPEKISIWPNDENTGIVIDVNINDSDILEKLNSDQNLLKKVAKSLEQRASYQGSFKFGYWDFNDDIPF